MVVVGKRCDILSCLSYIVAGGAREEEKTRPPNAALRVVFMPLGSSKGNPAVASADRQSKQNGERKHQRLSLDETNTRILRRETSQVSNREQIQLSKLPRHLSPL